MAKQTRVTMSFNAAELTALLEAVTLLQNHKDRDKLNWLDANLVNLLMKICGARGRV